MSLQYLYTRSKKFCNNVFRYLLFNEESMYDQIKDMHVLIRMSTKHKYDIKGDKAITMMRGKSPRSDVEMTKKLNFVTAILAFLNEFRPNLVDKYKITSE